MSNRSSSHSELVAQILIALGERPDIMVERSPTGTFRTMHGNRIVKVGDPGRPDIKGSISVDGLAQAFVIEAKTGSSRLSKDQRKYRAQWVAHGGLYIEARAVDDALLRLGDKPWRLRRSAVVRMVEEQRRAHHSEIELFRAGHRCP